MTASRELARAARRLKDRQDADLAGIPWAHAFIATVTSVTSGGGGGGSLVQITYRGVQVRSGGYVNSYTPAVNDRVICLSVDAQPIILGRIIGYS